jgi:hypothetical protein
LTGTMTEIEKRWNIPVVPNAFPFAFFHNMSSARLKCKDFSGLS